MSIDPRKRDLLWCCPHMTERVALCCFFYKLCTPGTGGGTDRTIGSSSNLLVIVPDALSHDADLEVAF